MKRRVLLFSTPALAGAALFACGPTPVPDRRRELLRSWGTKFLLANYRAFVSQVDVLARAAEQLEQDPAADNLEQAQKAWSSARRPWKEAEVFKFGPAEDEPLRYGPKIDFWPARPEAVDTVLADSGPIEPGDLGAAAKGLPAVEYLLFGEGALAAFGQDPRRHTYLRVLIEDLMAQGSALGDAWDPDHGNYLDELVDAGGSSEMYDTLSMALSEVVNRMAFTIENARADKLSAGIAPDGTPQPEKLESRFSERSIEDIQNNLDGVEALYFGRPADGVSALDDYLVHRGYHLARRVRDALEVSRIALDRLVPLTRAVEEAPLEVEYAVEVLGELQRLIQVDVIGALSLTVRFNDNDGD